MTMTVRCKFAIESLKHSIGYAGYWEGNKHHDERVPIVELELNPVSASDPGSENYKFWSATPSGKAAITLIAEAAEGWAPGTELYIDLQPINREAARSGSYVLPENAVGRVRCWRIAYTEGSSPVIAPDGSTQLEDALMATVDLTGHGGKGEALRNATIEFGCVNQVAVDALVVGGECALILSAAPAAE